MLTTLTLAAAVLAAPVPKDAKPAGPAPRMLDLKADADGKIKVDAIRTEKKKVQRVKPVTKQVTVEVLVNGKPVKETRLETQNVTEEVEVAEMRAVRVALGEVRELKIYTADGKEADREAALKKLADGGVVVVANDGQKVDPKYLKLLRDDVLVLVSPELARPTLPGRPGGAIHAEFGPGGEIGVGPAIQPQALPVAVPAFPVPPGALPEPPKPPPLPPPPKGPRPAERKPVEK